MIAVPAPPSQDVINAWVEFLTPIVVALFTAVQIVYARLAHRTADATRANGEQLTKIHGVVNGRYGEALATAAEALEKVATLTQKAEDIAIAHNARALATAAQIPVVCPAGLPIVVAPAALKE